MSKVLVDRELLERCVERWACCAIVQTPGAEQAWLELRAVVKAAQPAEAEGVDFGFDDRSVKVSQEAYSIFLARERHHLAALSAVTAERDAANSRLHEVAVACAEAEQERDQLRAEVECYVPLHEAIQRAAGELPEGWAIQLYIERDGGGVELIGPDGTEDFATNNERLDYAVIDALEAAMAAKEA